MKKRTPLDYSFFKKKSVLIAAGVSVGILQVILFTIYKGKSALLLEALSNFDVFFKKLMIDRLFIESISILLLFFFTWKFGKYLMKYRPRSTAEMVGINLRYLPLLLLTLSLFVLVAIPLRHFWRNDLSFDSELLTKNFRNYGRMYLQALIPFLAVGYFFFNLNIYRQHSKSARSDTKKGNRAEKDDHLAQDILEVVNENGNLPIKIMDIYWIEKKDRAYEVRTFEKMYYVKKTLTELETVLIPKGFIRINRGVIVNKNFVKNYSFWEFDKFILRMTDNKNTEFIVSRDRMRQIKSQLA